MNRIEQYGADEPSSQRSRWNVRDWIGKGSRQSVAQVVGGTLSAQVLALLALPVLSRIYTPSAFGVMSLVLSVALVLSGIISLRLDLAIPNAVEEGSALGLARLGLVLSALISVILASLVAWSPTAQGLSAALSGKYLGWTFGLAFLSAAFAILSQLFIWQARFVLLGWRSFWQGLVSTASAICLGLAGLLNVGLLLSQALGRLAAIGLMARSVVFLRGTRSPGLDRDWRTLSRYPILFMPAGVLNAVGGQLPLLVVATWYGVEAAGLLGVAQRILAMPAAIVGLAIGQVFLGRLSAIRRSGLPDQRRVASGALRILLPAGLAIGVGALLLAPLASGLLGDEWVQVSAFIQAAAIVFGSSFVAAPMQQILVANARGGLNLLLDASRVVLVGGAAGVAHMAGLTAVGTVLAMSLAQTANYGLTIALAWVSATSWDREHARATTQGGTE